MYLESDSLPNFIRAYNQVKAGLREFVDAFNNYGSAILLL